MVVPLATPSVAVEHRADGSTLFWSRDPLRAHAVSPVHWLRHWGEHAPDRVLVAERPGGDAGRPWRTVTYRQATDTVDSIAQGLIDIGLSGDRPLLALSGNSIAHALLMLAGYVAGVPFAPVSTAYSLLSADHHRLRELIALTEPAVVFADDTDRFAAALTHVPDGVPVIACAGRRADVRYEDLAATAPTAVVAERTRTIGRDDVAKILFTSGSTSAPKAVVQTHGMMTANQQSLAQCWTFVESTPPVLLDWLPWSHVFGANNNFNLVLRNGGTHYIDAGRPTPDDLPTTVANLRDVAPTILFNVPAGHAALLPHLERDDAFARHVFSALQMIFYAGSALPQDLWDRLRTLAARHAPTEIPLLSSWGSTETAPACTAVHSLDTQRAAIGTPVPGVTVKLVPHAGKLEMRVKGPNVTPGYLARPDLTAAAFDDEGFYRMGDAGRFADADRPELGLLFDGRVAEDFKLTTGTWVHVGRLRVDLLGALAPYVNDVLVAGHERADVRALAWPSPAGSAAIAERGWPAVAAEMEQRLVEHGRAGGSSMHAARLLLLADRPSIDGGEITDKSYVNQRVALGNRAHLVELLYAADAPMVVRAPTADER